MEIQRKFGVKLRALRLERSLTQEKLAHLADIDWTYVPGIEKGERNVSLAIIEKLAKALNIEIKDFFK